MRPVTSAGMAFCSAGEEAWYFLKALDTGLLQGCVLLNPAAYQDTDAQPQALSFIASLGISQKVDEITSVSEDEAISSAFKAFRMGWLKEVDAVLDAFGALRLREAIGRVSNVNTDGGTMSLRMKAGQFPQAPDLAEELRRIFASGAVSASMGHPVHYVLEMPKHQGHQKAVEILLSGLYLKRRIQRRRYQTLRFSPGGNMDESLIREAVQASLGGALVLDFVSDCPDEQPIDYPDCSHMVDVCMHAGKYTKQVLLVFCFAAFRDRERMLLQDLLPDTALLHIGQRRLDQDGARDYLKRLADQESAAADDELFKGMESGQEDFCESELRAQYDCWYQAYLRRVVYPQYHGLRCVKQVPAGKKPQNLPDCPQQRAYDTLQTMIGLSSAKKTIDQLISAHRARKLYQKRGLRGGAPSMHLVFTGNPGTAKTSVARLYAKILKEEGILKRGELIEVSRAELVGKYVGWTARLVKDYIRKARGSVLFIDEAYSLLSGREGQFGEEAINTLVMEMENCREDTVIILAGYPERMESLLQFNPGLRSRIGFHITFDDYSPEEMLQILRMMAREQGFDLGDGVEQSLLPWLTQASQIKEAGNGRFVRNLLDKARMKQAARLLTLIPEELSDDCVKTLLPQDFEEPVMCGHTQTLIGFQ
ncbi:MAG: AAA family ATPase [Christensenellales bacterium]